jgi:tRNA (cytidine/uridine-2'-O-)-methyltransferase
MFSIVLFQPEIPPNTGNIIRLCANSGCQLHLIEPLGFSLDEKQLRRAGLDYHETVRVQTWVDFSAFTMANPGRLISISTKNERSYSDFAYAAGDHLVFGSETSGLPDVVREQIPQAQRLTIPMQPDSRSINLSNSVAIVLYEAWRQFDFKTS